MKWALLFIAGLVCGFGLSSYCESTRLAAARSQTQDWQAIAKELEAEVADCEKRGQP
jgi:hypothetical protein